MRIVNRNFSRIHLEALTYTVSGSNCNLEMLVSMEGGKPQYPKQKPPKQVQKPKKLNPHMTPSPGIELAPHWWEATALTTPPSLLPQNFQQTLRIWLFAIPKQSILN